ncbi:MAG: hypothetical protein EOO27_48960, partial [Comamonadaceae bacterium]
MPPISPCRQARPSWHPCQRRPSAGRTEMGNEAALNGATAQLAAFAHATTFADLPSSVRHAACRAVVNIVGCCLGGAQHEIVSATTRALLPVAGAPAAT